MSSIRRFGVVVPAVVLALGLSACGGDEERAEPSSTTTASSSTSTSEPARDEATAALAAAGAVTPADLGPAWQEHTPPDPDGVPAADQCAKRQDDGLLASLPSEATYFGAVSQRGEATVFLTSIARVFPDPDAAQDYVATLVSPEYVACEQDRLGAEETERSGTPGASYRGEVVALGDNEPPGLEGHVTFQFQATVDGNVQDANGTKGYYAVREDRTVVLLVLEAVYQPSDPPDVNTLLGDELARGVEAAVGRLQDA